MCGTCGNYSVKDWSWPWLAGRRSATLIARAAERLSRVHGIRILPAPNGWQVRMPTGSTHLVPSVTALARLAQVDPTAAPEVHLADSDELSVIDRRRTIMVRAAHFGEAPSAAAGTWPDILLSSETTVVTIDSSSSIHLLRAIEDFAHTASLAPYRDHIRMVPIAEELTPRLVVYRWDDIPETIGREDLPALCLGVAARLVALPTTDSRFREVRARCGDNGMVRIQSIGSTVAAMEVSHG